jgi:mannose-6-phosphate isomerase-like protein (cupin superfamily)
MASSCQRSGRLFPLLTRTRRIVVSRQVGAMPVCASSAAPAAGHRWRSPGWPSCQGAGTGRWPRPPRPRASGYAATRRRSDSSCSEVEHPIPPRSQCALLHRHDGVDEYSYVLEGRMGALLGDEVIYAEAGELAFKPRDERHTFWNAGDEPYRILEIISPAGSNTSSASGTPAPRPAPSTPRSSASATGSSPTWTACRDSAPSTPRTSAARLSEPPASLTALFPAPQRNTTTGAQTPEGPPPSPEQPDALAAAASDHGIEFVGPPLD